MKWGQLGKTAVVKSVEQTSIRVIQPAAKVKRQAQDVKRKILLLLWLMRTRNPLLFWGGVMTLSVILGASVALLTPIWSPTELNQERRPGLGFLNGRSLTGNQTSAIARAVNILVMGIDPVKTDTPDAIFAGASDTMLLVRLNPTNQSINVLSIPRDSQVVIPELGLAKISTANAIGGSALAARVVSRSLNNVPIDRYIRVNTAGLRELVDLLGGVEVFVPQQMLYKDVSQKLEINLDPGWQTLNGDQAVQFIRFRDAENGDLARVQRQQILLKAIRDRLSSPSILPRFPQITRIVQNYVDTNLTREELLALVTFGLGVEPQNLQMVLLPGSLSAFSQDPSSYWLNGIGLNRIMNEYFDVATVGVPTTAQTFGSFTPTTPIAVQNASGTPNLADVITKDLQNRGFTNVYTVSDYPDLQRQTQIIVQQGNLQAATDLKKVLGNGNIESASIGDLNSQITIRVGKDWIQDRGE